MAQKLIFIDGRYFNKAKEFFSENILLVPTTLCENISLPVAYHPDMVLFPLEGKTMIVAPCVYSYYERILTSLGWKLVQGNTVLKGNYPKDIAYNIAKVGSFAFGRLNMADPILLSYLQREGCTFIDVAQGYAKCSVCTVDENSLITSDPSIYNAAKAQHLDVLLIDPGEIKLDGYDYGFIGGAGGLLEKNIFLFFGDITKHSHYTKIKLFFEQKGIMLKWIPDFPLTDVGTIMSIDI